MGSPIYMPVSEFVPFSLWGCTKDRFDRREGFGIAAPSPQGVYLKIMSDNALLA